MGNCLSGCTARSTSGNGGETVISYAGGKFYQTTKEQAPCLDAKAQSPSEKQVKEYNIVQKELEALQSQITHSQAVLASLKFTFLEASAIRKNLDKVNRTTQTFQDSQPKSLENVSATGVKDKGWQQLTSSCPAIVHNIAVQTEFFEAPIKPSIVNDAEYFLPPIGSPLDLKGLKDPRLAAPVDPPNSIDLDIYRSCRKLSVLPEEEATGDDSPPGSRLAIARYPEQQHHSFESYLLPANIPQVIRQLSDPTTSRSTRRPLQVSTSGGPISEGRVGVQDSGLGSEVRIPSPTFTTLQDTLTQLVTISYSSDPDLESVITLRTPAPMSPEAPFKTPPDNTPSSPNQNSSSDNSLSFQTPTEITPGTESPVERLPLDQPPVCSHMDKSPSPSSFPDKPMLSVLLDDHPLPPPPPQALDAPNEGPLRRVPSKRGKVPLIRSMARTDSKTALIVPTEDALNAAGAQKTAPALPSTGPNSSDSVQHGTEHVITIPSALVTGPDGNNVPQADDINRAQSVTLDPSRNEEKNGLGMERQDNQAVFPSLSDAALKQLGLYLQANSSDDKEPQLADSDVESKYTSLVLAIKTDKLTLARRLELQNKLRDQAEINMTHEFDALKSVIQLLSTVCVDADKAEMFEKIRQQVETLYKATLRVSSTAEMYGAVQQENRLSKAVDIVLRHVDNLKQAHDKEKLEHEETKKLVQKETKPVSPAVSALKNSGKRRASIATLHQGQSQSEAVHISAEERILRRGSSSRRGSRSQLRRSNTHKDELKSDPHVEVGSEETLHDIRENVDRRCSHSHSLHPEDPGLSGASQPNSCTEGESETDDDLYYERLEEKKQELEIHKRLPNRYKFRKRSSFCAPPWVLKMVTYLQWLQPYEDFAMQARYALAGFFVLTAIGIVVSNFFVAQES